MRDIIGSFIEIFSQRAEEERLDLRDYHKNFSEIDKTAKGMLRKIVKTTRNEMNALDLINYQTEEKRVADANEVGLFEMLRLQEFATTITQLVAFDRMVVLLDCVTIEGISPKKREMICKMLKNARDLLIHAALKYFRVNNIQVQWSGREFVFSKDLGYEDKEILNLICQIMRENNYLYQCFKHCDEIIFLDTLNNLKFENMFKNRSTDMFYTDI